MKKQLLILTLFYSLTLQAADWCPAIGNATSNPETMWADKEETEECMRRTAGLCLPLIFGSAITLIDKATGCCNWLVRHSACGLEPDAGEFEQKKEE